jgi:predicted alpha/beta hydrolase
LAEISARIQVPAAAGRSLGGWMFVADSRVSPMVVVVPVASSNRRTFYPCSRSACIVGSRSLTV